MHFGDRGAREGSVALRWGFVLGGLGALESRFEIELLEGSIGGHEETVQERGIRGWGFGFGFGARFGVRVVSEIENELNEGG